jgi:hypothetical protein
MNILGSGPNDGADVRQHSFFKNVNWKDVFERRLEPPIKPVLVIFIKIESQAKHFHLIFTHREAKTTYLSSIQNSQNKYQSIRRAKNLLSGKREMASKCKINNKTIIVKFLF